MGFMILYCKIQFYWIMSFKIDFKMLRTLLKVPKQFLSNPVEVRKLFPSS